MRTSLGIAGALAVAAAGVAAVAQGSQSAGPQPTALQNEFTAAAQEFHVPVGVLLSVAYQESRWDTHDGQPSATGNYNVMGLTQVGSADVQKPSAKDRMAELNMRGDDRRGSFHPSQHVLDGVGAVQTSAPALHTLDAAAQLIGAPAGDLRSDMRQSVRGGAALLAQYEKQATGGLPTDPAQWYPAVERYSQSPDKQGAAQFAWRVFAHIQQGLSRTTADGQMVRLHPQPGVRPALPALVHQPGRTAVAPAKPVRPGARTATAKPAGYQSATAAGTGTVVSADYITPAAGTATAGYATATPAATTTTTTTTTPECPSNLACNFVPAAYAQTSSTDLSSYGNYDIANRPADGDDIKYIVIHDTESSYNSALTQFQDPTAYASAHYLIRSSDGMVTQMVPNEDIAWHAGNKYINMHSVGIEHEGYAISGASWYTESEYESSAALVKYLAGLYHIPLDREHILGHDDVPGPLDAYVAGMHWDPGPFWDWNHYMDLVGAPVGTNPVGSPLLAGELVRIAPPFSTANEPTVSNATAQPADFVYLRTSPSNTASLLSDAYIRSSGSGTTAAYDWGDKAVAGQEFVVAAQQGDWTAIWYGGQQAWFYNPKGSWTVPVNSSSQQLITAKDGATSIPVYGRAYPEASAYPSTITPAPVSPLSKYSVPAGQLYTAEAAETGDNYNAVNIDGSAPGDRTLVTGTTTYYPIRYNHRIAYVNTADVKLVSPVPPSATGTTMQPGQLLIPGYSLSSSTMTVTMQTDGNLVAYLKTGGSGNGPALWASGTWGHPGAYAVMQTDGNLVVYASGGGPSSGGALWSSGTWNHPGAYATVQTDGNLVVYSSGGGPGIGGGLWSSVTFARPQTISSGQRLKAGWWTDTQYVRLVMQMDGNLVMYRKRDGAAIWSSNSWNHYGAYTVMQSDGNLVVYTSGGSPLWATGTWGHSGAYAVMQNDGNLAVYASGGGPSTGGLLWSSNTSQQAP